MTKYLEVKNIKTTCSTKISIKCLSQLLEQYEMILKILDQSAGAVYLDLSKVFDNVGHDIVLEKLI